MRNEGHIIATDTGEQRLKRVAENCLRLGISIVETQLISQEGSDIPQGPFDAILIDAPCSNTGVLGKRPDARWRIQEDDLEELSRIQLRLLLAAANRLRPGGRIVYSTCSIEPEENTAVLEAASHFRTKLQLVEMHELVPGHPSDGGFQSLLGSS
jgi:16S rRNA (cytosine967-C5)-methyltransferase